MARIGFFVGALIGPLLFAQTTGNVEGRIVSSATGAPIGGVEATLRDLSPSRQTSYQTTTDLSGMFRIPDVVEATYTVEVGKSGWRQDIAKYQRPFDVSTGKGETVDVVLRSLAWPE
jgi:hypothetical protein